MKKEIMSLKEFLNFRKEAFKSEEEFICKILPGAFYEVIANEVFLTKLGF